MVAICWFNWMACTVSQYGINHSSLIRCAVICTEALLLIDTHLLPEQCGHISAGQVLMRTFLREIMC